MKNVNNQKEITIELKKVNRNNAPLAKDLQATIFPNEISPDQVNSGIETNNPQNFIAYHNEKPVGIVGFYTLENLPNHVLLNWYGVLPNERRQGYGRQILSLAIEKAKILYQNVDYLTYYTSKSHNKEAIILYNNIGFTTKDYYCKEDILNIKKLQEDLADDYVIGVYQLSNKPLPNFEMINLNIANEIKILKHLK